MRWKDQHADLWEEVAFLPRNKPQMTCEMTCEMPKDWRGIAMKIWTTIFPVHVPLSLNWP